MKSIKIYNKENLIEFASRLAGLYNDQCDKSVKKEKGQFFTPFTVANFMADLTNIRKESVSILDPGSGIGILSVALIEKLIHDKKVKSIELTCYETDVYILPYLNLLLNETKRILNNKINFNFTIIEKDFIQSNADIIKGSLFSKKSEKLFDVIISNPPYFKINKSDLPMSKFQDVISGQPNIYFLFMAISAQLLHDNGEMIFITPRSFCSGLYYNKFRQWLIKKVHFKRIHIFDSRKMVFSSDDVLQENIITKFTKKNINKIVISKTFNGNFNDIQSIEVLPEDVIYKSNGHVFFRIPSNQEELKVIHQLDKLPYNFYSLGIKISTGKVVGFRNKQYIQQHITQQSVPLLMMHNIKNDKIKWPVDFKDKAIAIKNVKETRNLLIETGNYILLKRFTTKEQKKRLVTACIFKEDFKKYHLFAIDNMVNYIHRPKLQLNKNQINGIAKYLSLPIVDLYFRILNGHTQVNANEIYALPFPSLKQIESYGKTQENIDLSFDQVNISKNDNHNIKNTKIAYI